MRQRVDDWSLTLLRPALLVVLSSAVPTVQGSTDFQVPANSIEQTLALYAAGDHDSVAKWLDTRVGREAVPLLPIILTGRQHGADHLHAAFLLEVAAVVPEPGRAVTLLRAGRSILQSRARSSQGAASDDRFAVLWHHTAIGVLQRAHLFDGTQEYLTAIDGDLTRIRSGAVIAEDRFELAAAVAIAELCCRGARVRDATSARNLRSALAKFDGAAAKPALRHEAIVRGASLLIDAGEYAEALAWTDRTVSTSSDRLLDFLRHIARARAFDRLGDADRAVAEYSAALETDGSSQVAAIGLAAALLRAGRPDEAVRMADRAKETQTARDPWAEFAAGDGRFVQGWLTAVRESIR